MYEQIVEQTAGRFGLDQHQTRQLLGALIGLVFSENHGGPEGFLQAFRDVGLGDVVTSWLGHGENRPLTAHQFETAIGTETVQALGARLGLPPAMVCEAGASMLPDAIDALSEQGELPSPGVLGRLREWFGDMSEGWGHIERWRRGGM